MNYGIPLNELSSNLLDDDNDGDESRCDYTRQLLLLFYFYFFIIISWYHFGISYSMSVVINSFEIELKYEIHLSIFSFINELWSNVYKLSTVFSFIQWEEKEKKMKDEGGIDFIIATFKKK